MSPVESPTMSEAASERALLGAVPAGARRILDVGCGNGHLGAALKQAAPPREVFGIEGRPAKAARAAECLDQVFALDLDTEDPPLPADSLDCIIYRDVLARLADPEAVLRRHRRLLRREGTILCAVPNVQHHAVLAGLWRSDFPPAGSGGPDSGPLRFFTYSTLIKLLLDSGFAPVFLEDVGGPCPAAFLAAAGPLLEHLGLFARGTERYLRASHYIVRGLPLWERLPTTDAAAEGTEEPLTFVACVSDEAILTASLLTSPCLRPGSPHEVLLARHCRSAAEGLNHCVARARHDLVVCVHQDVYLPRGWPARFVQQYRRAEAAIGVIGVAGVYGVRLEGGQTVRAGHVLYREHLLAEAAPLPAVVDTLDEVLLAVPRGTSLTLDPSLGFHLYGADLCLEARRRGLQAVALDAICFHHTRGIGLPPDFWPSADAFKAKWAHQLLSPSPK